MKQARLTGTLLVGLLALSVGCGPAPAPTDPAASTRTVRKTPRPSQAPSSAPNSPGPTPGASGTPSAGPTESPSAGPTTSPAASATGSPSPSPSASANPVLVGLGCKPAGSEVPVAVSGGTVAAVYGHGAVPALNVTRGTSGLTLTTPTPVDVVLTAHPGAPAARITAYDVRLMVGAEGGTAASSTTRVMIPAVYLPAAPATHFGRPVAVPVVLPVGQLKLLLADAGEGTTAFRAEVEFLTDAGVNVRDKDVNPLKAVIPLPLGATAGPAVLPATEACAGATPAPFVPTPVPTSAGGTGPSAVEWRTLDPYSIVRSSAGALSQTNVGIGLAAPPGSAGARIDAFEATYTYTTEAAAKAGDPPTVVGPVQTSLATPVIVSAATATAYGALASARLPFATASLAGLTGNEGVVVVTFTFKNEGAAVLDAQGSALKVSVPILVE